MATVRCNEQGVQIYNEGVLRIESCKCELRYNAELFSYFPFSLCGNDVAYYD